MEWTPIDIQLPDDRTDVLLYDLMGDCWAVARYTGGLFDVRESGMFDPTESDEFTHWSYILRPANVEEIRAEALRLQDAEREAERKDQERQANIEVQELPMQCGHALKYLRVEGKRNYCEICEPLIAQSAKADL